MAIYSTGHTTYINRNILYQSSAYTHPNTHITHLIMFPGDMFILLALLLAGLFVVCCFTYVLGIIVWYILGDSDQITTVPPIYRDTQQCNNTNHTFNPPAINDYAEIDDQSNIPVISKSKSEPILSTHEQPPIHNKIRIIKSTQNIMSPSYHLLKTMSTKSIDQPITPDKYFNCFKFSYKQEYKVIPNSHASYKTYNEHKALGSRSNSWGYESSKPIDIPSKQ